METDVTIRPDAKGRITLGALARGVGSFHDAQEEMLAVGFLPKDLEKQFPAGFEGVSLPGLAGFSDEFAFAWSAAEAGKRPEIGRLAKCPGGN